MDIKLQWIKIQINSYDCKNSSYTHIQKFGVCKITFL